MRTIVNISMAMVILFSSAVCMAKSKKPAKQAAEPNKVAVEVTKPAAEPVVAPAEPNTGKPSATVVTVNGTVVTDAQVEEAIAPRMQQMAGRVPDNMIPQYRQQIRKRVIEQLVVEDLVNQEEKKNNITISDAELTEQINKQLAGQNLTLDEFKALLKAYGTTYGEYQQNIRKRLMFEKMMETQFADKIPKPTDEQLKAFYDENNQQFHKPEAIHAEHILITPAKDANDPNKALAAARIKAEGILKKVKAGGNFEELAKQYSDCPSAKQGGDLGIQPKGNLVPEFEKAAYALKPGQTSDIVQTEFGYHIIKLIAHIDANTMTLEQAKDEITQALAAKQKEQIVMDYIQKIRKGADVKYTDESDKLDLEITGTKPAPTRKPAESAPNTLDESKQAPKNTGESKKD